jgi:hypothetical protein
MGLGHEKLNVYRLAIGYVEASKTIATPIPIAIWIWKR